MISASSLRKDRLVKAEIYAENLAPEYWFVDLASRSVFVHTDRSSGFGARRCSARVLAGIELTVGELFRPPR